MSTTFNWYQNLHKVGKSAQNGMENYPHEGTFLL